MDKHHYIVLKTVIPKTSDPSDDWVVLDFALGDGDGIGQHDGQGVEDGRVRSDDNHGSFRTGSLNIN